MDYTEAKGRNLNVQKMLMSCLLAIISTYGLSHLGNQPNNSAATNLLLTSALAIVSSYLFYRTLANKHSRRAVVIAFIFGLLFSLASFIPCIENSLASGLSLQDALVKGMIWSVTFLPLPISLFLLLLDVLDKPIDPSIETSGNKSSFLKNAWQIIISLSAKKYFFIAWLAIMVVWLVGYLGAFPGHYGYDAIFQINWYCNGIITSQHPLLHTYFLGFCIIDLGRNLFGSEMVGLVIYCLTQMLTMSAIFAFVAARMRSTLSNGISFATVLFIALVPYNMILAFSTTKDSLFGAFFLLSLYLTYELSYYIKNEHEIRCSWWIIYYLSLFASCLFRNNCIYAVLVLFIICCFMFDKYRKQIICIALGLFLSVWLFNNPICSALGVIDNGSKEMLSVPTQQLARAALDDSDKLSKSELEEINRFLPTWNGYASRIADNVKNSFNESAYSQDPLEFWRLWTTVGVKCPSSYLEAFFLLNEGFWNLGIHYPIDNAYHPYLELGDSYSPEYPHIFNATEQLANQHAGESDADTWIFIPMEPLSSGINSFLRWFSMGGYQSIPGLVLICSPASAIWMILIVGLAVIYRREYNLLPVVLLGVLYWGTLLLGPTALMRYIYGLLVAFPLFIGVLLQLRSSKTRSIS